MPLAKLQKLSLELAMAGRNDFEVYNPDSRYRVKGLNGEFFRLAMQRLTPGAKIGFDVRHEYEAAKKLFAGQR